MPNSPGLRHPGLDVQNYLALVLNLSYKFFRWNSVVEIHKINHDRVSLVSSQG